MYYVKRALYGPDPREQKRKVDAEIRRNKRQIDRQLAQLRSSETKSKAMARQCAQRGDNTSARLLARELVSTARHRERLHRSKAQLDSIQMQVGDAFALQKLQGSMEKSSSVMREVNQLVRLPELVGTMQALGQELTKAGIIDEMVTDTLETLDETEDLESDELEESQIQRVLDEILVKDTVKRPPATRVSQPPVAAPVREPVAQEQDLEDPAAIDDMRERLRALQS